MKKNKNKNKKKNQKQNENKNKIENENKNINKEINENTKEEILEKEVEVEVKENVEQEQEKLKEQKQQKEENKNEILEGNKNIAVYGKNKVDSEYFFLKEIINFKNLKENKGKVIGIVDKDFNYIKNFNVEETLDYVLELLSYNFGKIVDNVDGVMEEMGLNNIRKIKMKNLSNKSLRMVSIASNVILMPEYLFVYNDLNLNGEEREEELKILRSLSKKYNFKLIYLSMDKEEILKEEKIIEVK